MIKNLENKLKSEMLEKKEEVQKELERVEQREETLVKRDENIQRRELVLDEREQKIYSLQESNLQKKEQLTKLYNEEVSKLEEISNYSKDKAKDLLFERIKNLSAVEFNNYIKEKEKEAKYQASEKAKEFITMAMQRYAADMATLENVSVVEIPNEDMKGKLIGREGRNIRTIENVTGVDLIIDDTPGSITLSCFDPMRREIARICLETMIKDGKISPTRIEELYNKVTEEILEEARQEAKDVTNELGLAIYEEELLTLIGRMKYRTSYGQNLLKHAKEVAYIAGDIASELGEDVLLARRAGLLHDIGKVVSTDLGGSHVELGKEIAKKYKENSVVINSIASHHNDEEATSIIALIIAIADTISASRPGARRNSSETYFRRLEELEEIGNSFKGVDKAFVVSAGRELRVMVKPNQIDDLASYQLAKDIKAQIESKMTYPGIVKVIVIRETRVEEQAK